MYLIKKEFNKQCEQVEILLASMCMQTHGCYVYILRLARMYVKMQ